MAKRFTDSEKWKDEWFGELSNEDKLTYLYILDNCDAVGVWKTNYKLAEFQLGFKVNWENFKETLGEKRLFIFDGGWWFRKFCDFQYGVLSEDKKSPTILYYIKLLKQHRLFIDYTMGIYTPKEKDKEKELEKVKEREGLIFENSVVIERLKFQQYDDRMNLMRTYGFTDTEFEHGVDMFCLETENTNKDFSEVVRHFKKWVGTKVISIKTTAKDKLINNADREEKIKRNKDRPVGTYDKEFGG